jgi:hypothetical protein
MIELNELGEGHSPALIKTHLLMAQFAGSVRVFDDDVVSTSASSECIKPQVAYKPESFWVYRGRAEVLAQNAGPYKAVRPLDQ